MDATVIVMYLPRKNAGRVKFQIPYELKEEREAFKQLNGSFYHPTQRLWSLPNTEAHRKKVASLFGKKLKAVNQQVPPEMPAFVITEAVQLELDRHYQKMKLGDKRFLDSYNISMELIGSFVKLP